MDVAVVNVDRVAPAPRRRSQLGRGMLIPEFEGRRFTRETPVPTWWPIRRRLGIAERWARSPVLDVGAGTGWLALHLLAWGHDVTASDYDERARENFRANAAIAGLDMPIDEEDVTELRYADEQFASVFCISVLPCVRDVQAALAEVWRVLRSGGIAVFGQMNAYGAYAMLNVRNPRTVLRRSRFRGDIRQDVEQLHSPGWWKRVFARRFTVVEVIPLEIFSPLVAKVAGYDANPRWTRADVRLASQLPKELASEVIFVLRK
jgi:SAM-dependent methyltransferase